MSIILQLLDGKNQSESVLESPDMSNRKGKPIQLFLASNSPRRRELLSLTGWNYQTLSPQVDETPLPAEDGIAYVQRLAKSKVAAATNQAGLDSIFIAADTTVVDRAADGKSHIFGKPQDQAEAVRMLRDLRGHTHQVHTAISILSSPDTSLLSDLCSTDVPMRNYNDAEIADYVDSGDPLDKAGAYAIQHAGFHPVEKLDGCYANVMGLPLCHLTRSLQKLGIAPLTDVPKACQAALEYNCPVYSRILAGEI